MCRNASDGSTTERIFLAGVGYRDFNNCGKRVFCAGIRGFVCVRRAAAGRSASSTGKLVASSRRNETFSEQGEEALKEGKGG